VHETRNSQVRRMAASDNVPPRNAGLRFAPPPPCDGPCAENRCLASLCDARLRPSTGTIFCAAGQVHHGFSSGWLLPR
jgi:hypothetical protein